MKKLFIYFSLLLFISLATILNGCKKKENLVDPDNSGQIASIANSTIDTLNRIYINPQQGDSVMDTLGGGSYHGLIKITGNYIVEGIVSANDKSGNIYKKLYIQNATAGIAIDIDQTILYNYFPIGQKVFIKCKGLYLGQYGGEIQLGDIYNGTIGRISGSKINDCIIRDSLPGKKPIPIVLDPLNGPFTKYINMVVAIPRVRFPDAGQSFVSGVTTSRPVGDLFGNPLIMDGNSVILYTSSFADFANNLLPMGVGTLQGIFTVYGNKYEILVRDMNDLVNFADTGQTVIYQNYFYSDPADWYIFTATGNNPWTWSSMYSAMVANGYGGNAPCDTWLISPGLDLTDVTNPTLTFLTWTNYVDIGNSDPLEVKLSTDYSGSGDPSAATWSSVSCTLPPQSSKIWTASGDINLSAYHQRVYIGFRYRSSGNGSNTCAVWEVDTFKLTGRKN
jgi:hypothetical protein